MVLGIIGKIGSGKSLAVKYIIENYNAILFSCDDIAKKMIKNKEIDFKIDDTIAFFKDEKKQELCRNIVHKSVFLRINENLIKLKSNELLNKNNFYEQIVIIESALPGPMLFDMCDKTIHIDSNYEDIALRLRENRSYSDEKIQLVYESQKYYDKFYDKADYTIVNDSGKDNLIKELKGVLDEIHLICK